MGCDGGTIPKRDELVRTKKKAEQKDKNSERAFLWRHCSISQSPLHDPVVACGLGRLYNKDAVIMGLLEKALPDSAKHIKSIKDIKDLDLMANPAFEASVGKGDAYVDHQSAPYICPVIGIEMNGKFKFCFSWGCGCVVSERAMKQIKSSLCHKCQKPIKEEDVVILNPVDEDLDLMRTKLEARQARQKAEKKSKKIKQEIPDEPVAEGTTDVPNGNASTSGIAASSSQEPSSSKPVKIKKEKGDATSKNGLKRGACDDLTMKAEDFKKTKGTYSVAKDPDASNVYKSLFTSSGKAQNQMKAHWITYNPFYN